MLEVGRGALAEYFVMDGLHGSFSADAHDDDLIIRMNVLERIEHRSTTHAYSEFVQVQSGKARGTCNVGDELTYRLNREVETSRSICMIYTPLGISFLKGSTATNSRTVLEVQIDTVPYILLTNVTLYTTQLRVILSYVRDNSKEGVTSSGSVGGGHIQSMRAAALIAMFGVPTSEVETIIMDDGINVTMGIEGWALALWAGTVLLFSIITVILVILLRKSPINIDMISPKGVFQVADQLISQSGNSNDPRRKTEHVIGFANMYKGLHLTITRPDEVMPYDNNR